MLISLYNQSNFFLRNCTNIQFNYQQLQDTYQHKGLRKKLIEALHQKGISDKKVLQAMLAVPRHLFVDKTFERQAYKDIALRIDDNQTISQPYTVAYQTEFLDVEVGMKVLEIGTGSGYQAAVLSLMGAQVHTVERFQSLHEKAKRQFMFLNYTNIKCYYKDGFDGLPKEAPFDRVIVTAAAPEIPEPLVEQLCDKGKMVVPVNKTNKVQQMILLQKNGNKIITVEGPDFRFVPMLKGTENKSGGLRRLNQ